MKLVNELYSAFLIRVGRFCSLCGELDLNEARIGSMLGSNVKIRSPTNLFKNKNVWLE